MSGEYMKGADGDYYVPDGDSFKKVALPEGVVMSEVGNTGTFIATAKDGEAEKKFVELNGVELEVRDVDVFKQQRDVESHHKFFEKKFQDADGKPKPFQMTDAEYRQRERRRQRIQQTFEGMVTSQVNPGASPLVRVIKDNEYMRLHTMYNQAVAKGEHKQCEFQPIAVYRAKVERTKSRPILQGECGMIGPTILRLEEGYGSGTLIQVPDNLTKQGEENDAEEVPEGR